MAKTVPFFSKFNEKKHRGMNDTAHTVHSCVKLCWINLWLLPWFLFLCLWFYFCCGDFALPSWSPPETKDSAIDSPDAQRQEWFAQYFSFWLTTNLQTQGFSMSTKLGKKKKKKKTVTKKKRKKKVKTLCSLLSLIGLGINSLQIQST